MGGGDLQLKVAKRVLKYLGSHQHSSQPWGSLSAWPSASLSVLPRTLEKKRLERSTLLSRSVPIGSIHKNRTQFLSSQPLMHPHLPKEVQLLEPEEFGFKSQRLCF